MSLCSLFFYSFVFLSVIFFFPWVSTEWPGRVMLRSGQLHRPTNITHSFECVSHLPTVSSLSLRSFVFFKFSLQLMFFLSDTRFLSPLPIKELAVLVWTRKVDFPLQLRFNTFCSSVVPDKADLLLQNWAFCISFPFFCSVPVVPVLLWTSVLWSSLFTALPFTYVSLSSLHFSYHISFQLVCPPHSAFPCVNRSGEKRKSILLMLPSVQGLFHSQTSHHRHAGLTRGEEILT